MENVKQEFERWFQDLHQLYRSAHEPGVQGWHHMEGVLHTIPQRSSLSCAGQA